MYTNPPSPALSGRSSALARAFFSATLLLVLTVPLLAQSGPRESFLAIQRQVETIEPRLIKSTIVLRSYDGSGSGVIISPDGLALTAGHVVEGRSGRHLTAVLSDGRTFPVTVVASSQESDLGIIKLGGAADL